MVRAWGMAALVIAFGSIAADTPTGPGLGDAANVSVAGYGRRYPACRGWSDGCVLCTGDGSGASRCSTPGIACLPHPIICDAAPPQ